ncbi:MAG: TIGR01212 family radical SAM protein [Clostridia bacterium]|nr:TIGR01212 family radical SAM protein [Clostridia bacterium]
MKRIFGEKVYKVPLDAGFTCPNLDGRVAYGGCTYCSGRGSGDFAPSSLLSITEQYEASRAVYLAKKPGVKCIPYFQAHTNTYAPLSVLKAHFEKALTLPDAVGLAIATRADCLEEDVVAYLRELHERTFLTVELGLQTVHDKTAVRINRGHDYETFLRGYEKLAGLRRVIHLIDYLPGESVDMMLTSAKEVSKLAPYGVKLHLLYVTEGTAMAEEYRCGEVYIPTREEYVSTVVSQLEVLSPEIVIARLTGDAPRETLIAPKWSRNKIAVLNEIDKEMVKRSTYQGAFV